MYVFIYFLPHFLSFFLKIYQNQEILTPESSKLDKNSMLYDFLQKQGNFNRIYMSLWGTTLHKDLGQTFFFTTFFNISESKSVKKWFSIKCYLNGPFKIKFIKIHYDPYLSTNLDEHGIIRLGRAYILYTEQIKLVNIIKSPPPQIWLLQETSLYSLNLL